MPYFVYILPSPHFDKYYVGQTREVQQRLHRHNNKLVPSTQNYAPWELKLAIPKETRSEAVILEKQIKNLSKERIKHFILKYQ